MIFHPPAEEVHPLLLKRKDWTIVPDSPDDANWPWNKPVYVLLAERDGWACSYCGIALCSSLDEMNANADRLGGPGFSPLPGYAFAEKDHRVPRARGGTDELSNLVLACPRCNQRKGVRSEAEFRDILAAER